MRPLVLCPEEAEWRALIQASSNACYLKPGATIFYSFEPKFGSFITSLSRKGARLSMIKYSCSFTICRIIQHAPNPLLYGVVRTCEWLARLLTVPSHSKKRILCPTSSRTSERKKTESFGSPGALWLVISVRRKPQNLFLGINYIFNWNITNEKIL